VSHRIPAPRRLRKEYRHPAAGDLILDVRQFSRDTHPAQMLVAYTAEPGSPSFERLQKFQSALRSGFPAEPGRVGR
jgi:MmyB-like transcription regulator ligand binding domain